MIYYPAMNFGSNGKVISFIGLFFLASISLHSFAHIDESPIDHHAESECQSCHNEISSDEELFAFVSKKYFVKRKNFDGSSKLYLQLNIPYSSQAPPKIIF
tara:strand:+ start:1616 stop:1918 length:303 start_codon:yes stop_codon:yes gene_type:complete